MFQFGRSRLFNLWIQLKIISYYADWVSPFGYLRINAFFQLTEAFRRFRVLHRLLMPRHPPIALNSLTKNFSLKQLSMSYDSHKPYGLCYLLTFLCEDYPQALIFISEFVSMIFIIFPTSTCFVIEANLRF
jgi:hypothetical protein